MGESITITLGSSDQHLEVLQSKLKMGLMPLFVGGQTLEIANEFHAGTFMIHCRLFGADGAATRRLRHQLAHILSEMIVDNLQSSLLARVVQRIYGDLDDRERQLICQQAAYYLGGNSDRTMDGVPSRDGVPDRSDVRMWHRELRRTYVVERLLEYLDQADNLHLEGFINFRLPDYIDELEDAVDQAVDEMLIEREYRQFMRFLQYLVESQSPTVKTVHVLFGGDATYRLLDGTGNAIAADEFQELLRATPPKDIDIDDVLISTLIGISPQQVHLHDPLAHCAVETADTLRAVFQRRLHLCRGCSLCERRHRME